MKDTRLRELTQFGMIEAITPQFVEMKDTRLRELTHLPYFDSFIFFCVEMKDTRLRELTPHFVSDNLFLLFRRNERYPFEGIDTTLSCLNIQRHKCRNERYPFEGIDTRLPLSSLLFLLSVEMKDTHLREFTHISLHNQYFLLIP